MDGWKSILKADPTAWLLEPDNPSVRYYALTDLLDLPENDGAVIDAKKEIMKVGAVPKILARQEEPGYWDGAADYYTDKYKGITWQLIILAEHGADGADERIRKQCEFILTNSQDRKSEPERKSGGFAIHTSAKTGGGRHSEVIPCLSGNMIWSLLRLGYQDNSRVWEGVDWIVHYQRFDDGIQKAPQGWPYDRYESCWGKHTCHMGVVKALKALAEIPENQRTVEIRETIATGAEFLLMHRIHKRSHDLNLISKPGWLKFGFPLMYQTDVLEILAILTKLGYRDERMAEAVALVVSKQDDQGRWCLENTFNGRFLVNIEQKGKPSKWVTLNALRVLKRFHAKPGEASG